MKPSLLCIVFLFLSISIQAQTDSLKKKMDLSADFRFRVEQDWNSKTTKGSFRKNRTRLRIRARVGFLYQVNPTLSFGTRVRTGNPKNPQDPHFTLGTNPTAWGLHSISFERAFIRYKKKGIELNAGKFAFPFEKQNELFWNDNISPEGISIGYSQAFQQARIPQSIKLSVGHFLIQSSGNNLRTESYLQAVQLAMKFRPGQLSIYTGIFHFEKLSLIPGNNDSSTLDYSILNIGAHARVSSKHPITIGADYYHNLANYTTISEIETLFQDQNKGFAIYLNYGQLKKKKDVLFRLSYAQIQKYAVVDYFAQNDWARWDYSSMGAMGGRLSNFRGVDCKLGYALDDKIKLVMRAFIVESLLSSTSDLETGNRIRLDLDVRF